MNAALDQIRSYMSAHDFDAALRSIEELENESGDSPRLLVWKAGCLQLSDRGTPEEVERMLLRAVELDEEYVPALVELGWFRLNVQDDAAGAKQAFDRARELLKKQIGETYRGALACAQELRSSQSLSAFQPEFERDLLENLKYDVRRERPAG
ncbi:MAG TPA: hypothetical protein VMB85_12385 [Bryobacteraceae bacterium]|nr:hypothetical protein [Bryobacteraceae bacterium]